VPASPRKMELEVQMRSVNYRSPLPLQPPTLNTQPSSPLPDHAQVGVFELQLLVAYVRAEEHDRSGLVPLPL
jgi:hypothetical protein